jgi:putative ABC transport system permease protein
MFALFDNIRMAFTNLGSNKMRTALTMLGITIGVCAVILLVSFGQAVERYIVDQFTSLGSNLIIVTGKESTTVTNQFAANDVDFFVPLTESDFRALSNRANVPDALVVVANLAVNLPVEVAGREVDAQIVGGMHRVNEVFSFEVASGRWLDERDLENASRVAVLGGLVAEKLFGNERAVGQTIRLGNVSFRVEGVLEKTGSALTSDTDNSIFVPLTTAQRRLSSQRTVSGEYPVTSIVIKAIDEASVESANLQVLETMRREHDIDPGDEDDFQVFASTEILETLSTITGLLTVFLGAVAGISLVVGGIGIMNIMLVTVTERTREIGLRKAVGAQRFDILLQFLTESVTMASLGGAIGTSIAMLGAAAATALVPGLTVTVQMSSILVATAISVGIGAFFGAYPANRAAALNPIDALRYE